MGYVAGDTVLTPEALTALQALIPQVDLAPGPGGARITPVGDLIGICLAHLPTALGVRVARAALISLEPSSQLVAHTDPALPGPRVHIPLLTNPGCWSFLAGVWSQLLLGYPYVMDPTEVHGAVNWGTTRRVHLILDLHG